MTTKKQYVRVNEYSQLRSVGKSTIWRWIKEGKLKSYKIGAKITVLDLIEADTALGLNMVEVA